MIYYIFTGVLDILNSSHEIMVPKCTHTILLCQNVYGFKTGHDKYQKIKNFEPGTDIKYVHNLITMKNSPQNSKNSMQFISINFLGVSFGHLKMINYQIFVFFTFKI